MSRLGKYAGGRRYRVSTVSRYRMLPPGLPGTLLAAPIQIPDPSSRIRPSWGLVAGEAGNAEHQVLRLSAPPAGQGRPPPRGGGGRPGKRGGAAGIAPRFAAQRSGSEAQYPAPRALPIRRHLNAPACCQAVRQERAPVGRSARQAGVVRSAPARGAGGLNPVRDRTRPDEPGWSGPLRARRCLLGRGSPQERRHFPAGTRHSVLCRGRRARVAPKVHPVW